MVSAREIRTCPSQVVRTRYGVMLVISKAVALGVTGQETVGGVVERTFRHRLHVHPVGRRREDDARGVASFSRGAEVELTEIGCLHFLVTRHDSHLFCVAPEDRTVRGLGTGESHVQIDGKALV